ncbi:WYL domain-containing protein [Photobacterium sp. 1_MG-2023]|uniref:WYL domain-containing protein n=1 Tax=Photobacterium sp. 1_MG-2023 TaxID=3062646 RepID=UPI0026E3EB50|nr:WYL domain-containing protein [Photobacterium sp. 1_MG-2023]MDO6706764.1 hypothetical protein [Photobacterium sp. 1_MG-2023]
MTLEAIKQAIQQKLIIQFTYSGRIRIVEPHVLGITKGNTQILGYQVDGESSSGGLPEWRRFDLEKMSDFFVTKELFPGRRPFPSGLHSSWDVELEIVPA